MGDQALEGALLQVGLHHEFLVVVLDALVEDLGQVGEDLLEVDLHLGDDLALEQVVDLLLQGGSVQF